MIKVPGNLEHATYIIANMIIQTMVTMVLLVLICPHFKHASTFIYKILYEYSAWHNLSI